MESEDYSPSIQTLAAPHDAAGHRLDAVLAGLLPEYSRSRITQWIRTGQVRVDGLAVPPRHKLAGGETITVESEPLPEEMAFRAEDVPLEVVYADAAIYVINKPAGLVVHPGSGNWQGTLLNGLLHLDPALAKVPRAGIVHRLDKETSGLLVVARSVTAQTALVRALQAHVVQREYLAVAWGAVPASGRIEAPVGRHPTQRTKMAVVASGKPAVTHFERLDLLQGASLVRCRLETGRTHQIRVHLASQGHPLVGDPVYSHGRPAPDGFSRQALHAARLALDHPLTGKVMAWEAPLPDDMQDLIATLREKRDA